MRLPSFALAAVMLAVLPFGLGCEQSVEDAREDVEDAQLEAQQDIQEEQRDLQEAQQDEAEDAPDTNTGTVPQG